MKIYQTYLFRNKDPIIDRVHTLVQDSGVSLAYIENKSGVRAKTIYNWFNGAVRRPQHATIAAVASALGYDMTFSKRTGASAEIVPLRSAKRSAK